METVIRQFLPSGSITKIERLSGGLIHQTNKVTLQTNGETTVFVLQAINTKTFREPDKIMKNLNLVRSFLIKEDYPLIFPQPLKTTDSKLLFLDENGVHWRMFPFVENSTSYDIPPSEAYLYEAGKAYGIFLTALKKLDPKRLEITIPDFHNLDQRFQNFRTILDTASLDRKLKANIEINQTVNLYNQWSIDLSKLPIRVVHNDSKLSNLLFDKNTQKCIAVIDLDTLMPGYVVTDFGDMVRGMCNTVTEDEKDLKKVSFNPIYYNALQKGFLHSTEDWLNKNEKDNLLNGAIYIILEQAIRFLSDYLNNDQYYPTNYPEHNYDRAKNQLALLNSLLKKMF